MPAIYLFNRRTNYGGDDLHVLALVTGAVRFFQLCCYSVLVYHIVQHVHHNMNLNTTGDGTDGGTDDTGGSTANNMMLLLGEADHHPNDTTTTTTTTMRNLLEDAWFDATSKNNADCSHSHLFPMLLMSYTGAGILFCLGSSGLLVHIYRTSSMGCPTLQRHPRTEIMEQLLQWLFLPMNILHGLVWLLGVCSLLLAFTYLPCNDNSNNNNDDDDNNDDYRSPSTAFTVLWVLCAMATLISQGIEVFWNTSYVMTLHYHDPHALQWTPNTPAVASSSGRGRGSGSSNNLQSYHHSSSNSLSGMMDAALPAPSNTTILGDYNHMNNHELVEQMWADRCQNMCRCLGMGTCYVFGGRELYGSGAMHYGDFARAMADYLETRGVLDVVPSDIIVGFMVLQQLQIQRRHSQRQEVIEEHSKINLFESNATGLSGGGASSNSNSSNRTITIDPFRQQKEATNLHNHRALAKGFTPKGMQLQSQNSSNSNSSNNGIEVIGPENLFQTSSSNSINGLDIGGADSLMQHMPSHLQLNNNNTNNNNNQDKSARMMSMGAGCMLGENALATIPSVGSITTELDNTNHVGENVNVAYGTNDNRNSSNTASNNSLHDSGVQFDHSSPPPKKAPSMKSLASTVSGSSNGNNSEPSSRFQGFQRVLSVQNHADVLMLQEGARYSRYALAIYTWYLYLFVNPVTGIPKLCAKAWNTKRCLCCFAESITSTGSSHHPDPSNTSLNNSGGGSPRVSHSHGSRWEGDNLCQPHKHALLLQAGLENEADLVYVQLKSSFNANPYCILVDHEAQTVVVAIRGTFSLEDCVTDVLLEPSSLEALGEEFGFGDIAKGQYCHGGVMTCARNVHRDLQRHGSLEYLLGTKYPHYQLRLVGHSLGAACAVLLGFMMRQTYPNLRCFNYSPPGGTLTWDLAMHCQSWCTSFVLDTEVVPRMSFENLENLRDEVLDLIGRIRVSKIEVARRVATKNLWCGGKPGASSFEGPRHEWDIEQAAASVDALDELLGDLLLPLDAHPPTDSTSYRQQLAQFQAVQSERRSSRGTRRAIRMFPPGKILHLVKTTQEANCMIHVAKCVTCCTTNAGSQYTPVWIGNGDLNEIVISPTMGTDHFPNRMVDELEGIVNNFEESTRFL